MKKCFIEGVLVFLSVSGSFFIKLYRIKQSDIETKNNLLKELAVVNEDLMQISNVIIAHFMKNIYIS